jgi:UDP-glucose 4-epimerase
MFREFSGTFGLNWKAWRYFNAAGVELDGEIGEAHDPETHLMMFLL